MKHFKINSGDILLMMQGSYKKYFPNKSEACVFLLLMAMLLIPVIYREFGSGERSIFQLLSSILYLLPLPFLLMAVRHRVVFGIITFVLMLMSAIEVLMVCMYGNYITAGNVLSVLGTNWEESTGFLSGIIYKLYVVIPVLLLWISAVYLHNGKIRILYYAVWALLSIFMMCAFVVFQLCVRWEGKITSRFYIEQNIFGRPPYNFVFQLANAWEQMKYRRYIADAENMTYDAHRVKYNAREAYVLFIGESLRYDNLSLGGYERSTTPLLESLANVTLYSDYYSTATLTMYSVPQILTCATPDDYVRNYKEKTIIAPFNECGFKTFVICAGNLLANERYLSNGCDSLYILGAKDDECMAGIVDSLVDVYPKTFFIVQGIGNHGPYENFRKEQDVYHPNPVTDNVSWSNHDAMVNAYDNTVLFTDYNVYNIIKAIDKPNMQSAFMLISDHGADYDTGVSDHGGNCNPGKNEYHVPLIFWHSTLWGENHREKALNIRRNREKPINADNVFYSLCDMADIEISKKYAKIEWSVFSDKLQLHQRKILVPDGKNTLVVK